ncbi:MAG: DNA translocase FtsK [Candidatus Saccharibacteria bacterium]|nr:DNA translocase FtsK [Candidatus Saccharibacteria bacterium]
MGRKSKSSSKAKPIAQPKPKTDNSVSQSVKNLSVFFLFFLISLFLVVGSLDWGGDLPIAFAGLVSKLVGWLTWSVLPILILYLAFMRLQKIKDHLHFVRLLSGIILILTLAGILHVLLPESEASQLANQGRYGGYLGYGISQLFGWLLHSSIVFLIFFFIAIIALLSLLDTSVISVIKFIKNFLSRKQKDFSTDSKSKPQPAKNSTKLTLNSNVPLENSTKINSTKPKVVAKKVLTTPVDSDWQFPPLNLLSDRQDKTDAGDVQANAEIIRECLANFNIDVEMEGANIGPRVTQYTLRPPSGIKLAKIVGLESNIALDLAASSIRIEAPIPGQKAVGIEVPNKKAATVRVRSLFDSEAWQQAVLNNLAFGLGQDISGQPEIAYLTKMPHLLLAGQTGAGKSVSLNILLASLLYRHSPNQLKLILVDPKQVELGLYNDIPHLLTPVITSPEKCISALKWTVAEMERRLKTFAQASKRNIEEYNALDDRQSMPFIVVVIDELADLMMVASRDMETLIVRIAQKARAAGIHLVLATQRPSVDVITGLIKANIPARIAFTVASQIDSRTILDQVGAEKLLGSGDMLFVHTSLSKPKRLQGAFMTEAETKKICDYLRQQSPPEYDNEIISQEVTITSSRNQVLGSSEMSDAEDELFSQAVEAVIKDAKASTSLLQRRLRIGYARAARLIEDLEDRGVISPADGSRPRTVLVKSLDELQSSPESVDDTLDSIESNSDFEDMDDTSDEYQQSS